MVSVIIPAAGRGTRMNCKTKKQFLTLKGKPIIVYTLEKFHHLAEIDEIILITSAEDILFCRNEIVGKYGLDKVTRIAAGGNSRQESVWLGIQELSPRARYIMVHDGARPFVTREMIMSSIKEVKRHDAVVVGTKVKDTIKILNGEDYVQQTPPRHMLRAIQTPQTFAAELLVRAYSEAVAAGYQGTDEASLVERIGGKVKWIPGSENNIKITTPKDLLMAEMILEETWGEER